MTSAGIDQRLDYLLIERALSGTISLSELNPDELRIYQAEKAAFDIGRKAHRYAGEFLTLTAAIKVARDPRSNSLLTSFQPNQAVPTEIVSRVNGTHSVFDSQHYIGHINQPEIEDDLARLWLAGALLDIGDDLKKYNYFMKFKRPELELLYHLRNGIAHGNCFNIDASGKNRLAENPAHNKMAVVKVPNAEFEITPALNGSKVLFEFMGRGDILDLFRSVEFYLTYLRGRIGTIRQRRPT
jgi:hypothetical protein